MKLYYAKGACSLGIHIELEEIGCEYETETIDLRAGQQNAEDYRAINPKGRVPALRFDDGAVLTEYGAIALYLARLYPEASLLPTDLLPQARAVEAMEYVVGTIHGQGFFRMFRPERFTPNAADHDAVRAEGRRIFSAGLAVMDETLAAGGGAEWVAGEYSVADPALFYVVRWAEAMNTEVPAQVAKHAERMRARPAVQRALAAEGLQ